MIDIIIRRLINKELINKLYDLGHSSKSNMIKKNYDGFILNNVLS